jgi:predicted kinase
VESVNIGGAARKVPAPGLLVLTGASHTGKTSVAREILRLIPPPAAFLSVDDTLSTVLVRSPGDAWAQIPLAYELLASQAETLLDRGWFLVFESTFTYVPRSASPEFHDEELNRLIDIAERRGTPWALAQLSATDDEIASRAEDTQRLPREVVAHTTALHESAQLPGKALRLDSSVEPPSALAQRVLGAFGTGL